MTRSGGDAFAFETEGPGSAGRAKRERQRSGARFRPLLHRHKALGVRPVCRHGRRVGSVHVPGVLRTRPRERVAAGDRFGRSRRRRCGRPASGPDPHRRGARVRRRARAALRARRLELLLARAERQRRLAAGELPDFLSETRELREADWAVAPVPADLLDRRVEITGPGRPQDGHQRAQLGRAASSWPTSRTRTRRRGRNMHRGPGQPARRGRAARSRSTSADGKQLPAERRSARR